LLIGGKVLIPVKYKTILTETEMSWLLIIKTEDGIVQTWFPKSKCHLISEDKTIMCPEWIVDKNVELLEFKINYLFENEVKKHLKNIKYNYREEK
jgi:hypothetical protein